MAAPPQKTHYDIKSVETIAAGRDVRVRLYTLAPEDVIPWHFHSEVTDWYFCLMGQLAVETRSPNKHTTLEAGGSSSIPPNTAHRISNAGATDCRFLLVQGVGQYDFHAVET